MAKLCTFLQSGVQYLLQLSCNKKMWSASQKREQNVGFFSSENPKFPIRKQFSHKSIIVVPFNIHISFLPKKRNCPHRSL